ncbi:hypothetical protein C8F01DRAFT_1156931 [Mycena amicta]|nr:hypothetical protein C8F01DRAFT_1156931 [Mycena amicta]
MEALPVELHSKIYGIACKDDGTTSRALSQVSRRIYAVSAAYRYHSIVVCGPTQIQKLVDRLRAVPRELRRIRYLFIYDHSPIRARSPFQTLYAVEAAAVRGALRNWIYPADLSANLVEILSMAQPTVEVLSIVSVKQTPTQWSLNFPSLRHLTILGPYPVPRTNPAFAPQLITLHVTENALPLGFAATLAQNHPHLTRLRISRCIDVGGRILDMMQLARAMGIAASTKTPGNPPPPQLCAGVKRLLIFEPCTHVEFRNFDSRIRVLPTYRDHGPMHDARLAQRDWRLCVLGEPMEWEDAGKPFSRKRPCEPTQDLKSRLGDGRGGHGHGAAVLFQHLDDGDAVPLSRSTRRYAQDCNTLPIRGVVSQLYITPSMNDAHRYEDILSLNGIAPPSPPVNTGRLKSAIPGNRTGPTWPKPSTMLQSCPLVHRGEWGMRTYSYMKHSCPASGPKLETRLSRSGARFTQSSESAPLIRTQKLWTHTFPCARFFVRVEPA